MRAVLLTGQLGGTEATTRYNVQQNESHSENKIFLKNFTCALDVTETA